MTYEELKAEVHTLYQKDGVDKQEIKNIVKVYARTLGEVPPEKYLLLHADLQKLKPERKIGMNPALGMGFQGSTAFSTGYAFNYTEAGNTMFSRQGYWGSTFTGKRIYLDEPRAEDFCIMDIAHGLSNVCRYGGQCISFYSVAEHSYRGAKNIEREGGLLTPGDRMDTQVLFHAYEFLLHDAAEAYVGDQIRPVVMYLDAYREMRDRMQAVINLKFGIPPNMSKTGEAMDERMLSTESRIMFNHDDKWWESPEFAEPIQNEWVSTRDRPRIGAPDKVKDEAEKAQVWDMDFMHPRLAKRLYLEYFNELYGELALRGELPRL